MGANIAAGRRPQYHRSVLALAFAFVVAAQQENPVLDVPVYSSAQWGVSLPRPFDDWVFSPATSRGTTTVIFQPRAGALSDQLWGALVLSPWGRAVPLSQVADRRIATTWRSMLGHTFQLVSRDSFELGGLPVIRLLMSGAISLAVLEVEEYLVARDSDLIALQFRYPRGQPRDSISAGYLRSLEGLRVRVPVRPARTATASTSPWSVAIDRGLLLFDLPQEYQAVAPGWLSSEVVAQGRRAMRWTPLIGEPDTTVYAVGQFRLESRRAGRLTFRVWRNVSTDSSVTRVSDDVLATLARTWAFYWRSFGPVPSSELAVVETAWRRTRGAPSIVYLGADARSEPVLRRELARSWWGQVARRESPATAALADLFATWSADLHDSTARDSSNALERTRRVAGDDRFREAAITLLVESRAGGPGLSAFLSLLGDSASAHLRMVLRQQNR